jgi:glycosyltransferase involved in cell wall biosynthesis
LPYKNVDKVIEAFQELGLRLIVVGKGPEEGQLRARAADRVLMLSDLPEEEIRWLYLTCELLVTAALEDYGLTPLEAASFGKPSVVLRWGGFLDTVKENETGVFFDHPSSGDIANAVMKARSMSWNAGQIRKAAERFSEERFIHELQGHVATLADSAPK